MEAQTILATLNDLNPDAVLFDNMDSAIVGVGYIGHMDPVAVYSRAKIYEKLLADGLSEDDAEEYYSSKFVNRWCAENTPVIIDDTTEL